MRALIVLGNRMKNDGSLSEIMLERLALAKQLILSGEYGVVILSGGMANRRAGVTEAEAMYKWLLGSGVTADLLKKEERSKTTRGNAVYGVAMAISLGADSLDVCTSAYHAKRSINNARTLFESECRRNNIGCRMILTER